MPKRKGYRESHARERNQLFSKAYDYLLANFHKLKPEQRIRVGLELIKKEIDFSKDDAPAVGNTYIRNDFSKQVEEMTADEIRDLMQKFRNRGTVRQ